MDLDQLNLGERIVYAARMAVAMHLQQAIAQPEQARRITIGGADLDRVTDDSAPQQLDWARGLLPAPTRRCSEGEAA